MLELCYKYTITKQISIYSAALNFDDGFKQDVFAGGFYRKAIDLRSSVLNTATSLKYQRGALCCNDVNLLCRAGDSV